MTPEDAANRGINVRVGRRIRAARDERGLTQEQLAEHLHTTDANFSRKESGKVPVTIEELFAIADFLEHGSHFYVRIILRAQAGVELRHNLVGQQMMKRRPNLSGFEIGVHAGKR